MFGFLKRKPPVVQQVAMTEDEIAIIRQFASGEKAHRNAAIAIHHAYIPTIGVRGNIYQQFMAEVDNPVPDHDLRAYYRQLVVQDGALSLS